MKITLNHNDIGYNSSSTQVEAFRRALEIRSLSRDNGSSAWRGGVEICTWETPLYRGKVEVETVTLCDRSGVVTYARAERALAC